MQTPCPRRYDIIDNPTDLERLAAELERETTIAVDLEADSMFHYKERVCLIQLAVPGRNFILDTVAVEDLACLRPVFRDTGIKKVFHGADYDVRSLYRDFEIRVNPLFDTQLACRFLGMKETGLDAVLKNMFDIGLNKKFQRKDWSRRPLPEEMLKYAVEDVCNLLPLAEQLENQLRDLDRSAWVREECRLLSNVRAAPFGQRPLFLNCKGAGRLEPLGLAVLEGLLSFRQELARTKDRPLFKVFSHETLLKLAQDRPGTLADLQQTAALSATQIERYGREILATIKSGMRTPAAQLPSYPRKKPQTLSTAASTRLQALRRWRDSKARRLKIEPSLICSKSALMNVALQRPKDVDELEAIPELRQWQRKNFGMEIVAALLKN
jgi:ribonuclease D